MGGGTPCPDVSTGHGPPCHLSPSGDRPRLRLCCRPRLLPWMGPRRPDVKAALPPSSACWSASFSGLTDGAGDTPHSLSLLPPEHVPQAPRARIVTLFRPRPLVLCWPSSLLNSRSLQVDPGRRCAAERSSTLPGECGGSVDAPFIHLLTPCRRYRWYIPHSCAFV